MSTTFSSKRQWVKKAGTSAAGWLGQLSIKTLATSSCFRPHGVVHQSGHVWGLGLVVTVKVAWSDDIKIFQN